MTFNEPGTDDYPDAAASRWPAAPPRWPAADIVAAWRRELPGVRTESIEIITPVWRIAKALADDRRRTLVTPGAVSQRVARAERAGLVERAPSSASRRAVAVRLTAGGHALIEATVSRLLDHEADLVSALAPAERTALTTFLAKLEQALT